MATGRSIQLEQAVNQLLSAYRDAKRQSDTQDIVTKATVTRSIIDSSLALANRLRTREHGVEKLAEEVEKYYQALRPEDLVEKSTGAAKWAASLLGIGAGAILVIGFKLLIFLFAGGVFVGNAFVRLLATGSGLYVGRMILYYLYQQYQEQQKSGWSAFSGGVGLMSSAESILQKTVDPAEAAVYTILGASRPVRTMERVGQGGNIILIVIWFIIGVGIVYGILNALGF